jgi:tetratricopeptide (TPR) repeat protein
MLIVRKGGGRNINNDRYLYLNVDDNPEPIPELRRLLDLNLTELYRGKVGSLGSAGKDREARDAAAKVVQYHPDAASHMTLGLMDYNLGDKPAALADFRKALQLDPSMRQRFQPAAASTAAGPGGRGQAYRTILEDKDFLKQLFPEN